MNGVDCRGHDPLGPNVLDVIKAASMETIATGSCLCRSPRFEQSDRHSSESNPHTGAARLADPKRVESVLSS
jgi:hypothetical protein